MLKQKVFFFAAAAEGKERMAGGDDLRQVAMNYVNLYGESCLTDPETPAFVRQSLAKGRETEAMQRVG